MTADPIGEAIARAAAQPFGKPLEQAFMRADIGLPSGRHVEIKMPANLSDAEFCDLIAVLSTQALGQARAVRSEAHRRLLEPR